MMKQEKRESSKCHLHSSTLSCLLIVLVVMQGIFIVCVKNQVPERAIIIGPTEGLVGEEDTFFITSTDFNEDSLSYLINWGDGNFSRWIGNYESGETVTVSHKYAENNTYTISALVKDMKGDTGDWSAPHHIEILSKISLKWRFEGLPAVYPANSPARGKDGTIYVVLPQYFYALLPTGEVKWKQPFSGYFLSSPSIDDDGTIYLGCNDINDEMNDKLVAFNSEGSIKWNYFAPDPTGAAINEDGTIYFGSGDSCLYALNPDGTLKWFYKSGGKVISTPIIGQSKNIYFGASDSNYYAIAPNGSFHWRLKLSFFKRPGAISNDETIYLPVDNGYLYAITSAGIIKWSLKISQQGSYYTSPTISTEGVIYIGTEAGLCAISQSGNFLWQLPKECLITPTLTADGSIITSLLNNSKNEIYGISAAGKIMSRTKDVYYALYDPVISNEGTIYVNGYSAILYALEGSSPLANSAWPMYQHDAQHTGRAGP